MKHLLRKIFFWDAPARGAFFGLTLMAVLPKLLLGAALPLFLKYNSLQTSKLCFSGILALLIVAAMALTYALVLFGHVLPKQRLGKAYVLVLCVCAVLMLGFWGFAPREFARLWWIFPAVAIFFPFIYMPYPAVRIRDWLYAIAPLALGIWTSCRLSVLNARALVWPTLGEPASPSTPWLMWTLTVGGLLLLALSYLLWGRVIAKMRGVSVRRLFGRGVATLWALFAVSYLTSVAMALHALHDYRAAKRELNAFWEMPVTPAHLEELYRQGGRIDKAFWDELVGLKVDFSALDRQYDGISGIVAYANAVLPPDIHAQWKTAFAASPELQRSEEMLDEPLPLPERKLGFVFDNSLMDVLSKCREITRLELWRVRLALEAADILAAQKALRRMDNLCAALQCDYNLAAGLVGMSIEHMRALALSRILESGLADEEWLREQDALLQDKERSIPAVHQRMIQGEAAYILDANDTQMARTSHSLFLNFPEAWLFLGREGAALARCHCVSDFADFPEKPTAILAGMQAAGLRSVGARKIPELVAVFRISRGMIAAERTRRRTGRHPEVLDGLPLDPFSGAPLKYAVGKCEIPEELFRPREEQGQEPFEITPEVLKQLGLTDEVLKQLGLTDEQTAQAAESVHTEVACAKKELQRQLGLTDEQAAEFARPTKYVFETAWRSVDTIQIWSVGPNGVDDGGVRSPDDKDDIRFVMTIHPENAK